MKRREFITVLAALSSSFWPLVARAQQPQQMRRIGVFMATAADDPDAQVRIAGLLQGLQELGWTVGRNLRIDWRWATADRERYQALAAELLALKPDVVLTTGATVRPLQQATRTVPIVFAGLADPVGGGYVASLARPGGNITGFASAEYSTSGKWLELLKQIAPRVTRVGVIRDPIAPGGTGQYAAIQAVSGSFGVELSTIDGRERGEIERAVAAFTQGTNGGLIVTGSSLVAFHRERIIALAAQHRLPAVYSNSSYVTEGGLISFGPAGTDMFRRAAGYVDRILKGEKPADLPVQAPTRYELVINLKTAKALGFDVPPTLQAIADAVIE
jgi:putative tryptophan/tyrosine transport system substrate-binding protein